MKFEEALVHPIASRFPVVVDTVPSEERFLTRHLRTFAIPAVDSHQDQER
jgi:hypothetical protein